MNVTTSEIHLRLEFAAFDLDRTLIRCNSSFAFSKYLLLRGYLSKADVFYFSLLYFRHMYLGLPLYDLHTKAFERVFKGRKAREVENYVFDFAKDGFTYYTPVLQRLLKLRDEGIEIGVFSSSPSFLVRSVVQPLGVDMVFGTEYEVDNDGYLTKLHHLMDGENKAKALREISRGRKTYAFSDSMIDIDFLQAADVPIVVRPSRKLYKLAKSNGWEIIK